MLIAPKLTPARTPANPPFVMTNAHLVTTTAREVPGHERLDKLQVNFDNPPRNNMGGNHTQIDYIDGRPTGIGLRMFPAHPGERASAQAVFDAITASGLLSQDLPGHDRTRPAAGKSRLYFERRTRMFEFDTASPPTQIQPILAAIRAWQVEGRKGARHEPGVPPIAPLNTSELPGQ